MQLEQVVCLVPLPTFFLTRGGVCVLVSYELGDPIYEENIIIDCFGKERLEEYRGKHKLDLLFV